MSVAAPPRPTAAIPYAETQPQRAPRHAAPDWLPVIGWFVDDGQRHSRINVVPMGNTVDPYERFAVTLKFFRGAEQPVHTFLSEPFAGDEIFRYESAALLGALGESRFEGLVEITARSLDNPPSHFPWVDSWLEFWADDGSLSGSVPGFVFKGGNGLDDPEEKVFATDGCPLRSLRAVRSLPELGHAEHRGTHAAHV